jgi:methylmalonyl-CoA mutase
MSAYRNIYMDGKKSLENFSQFRVPTYEEWRDITEKSLKGVSFEKKLLTHTYEGITLQPMYQEKDIADLKFTNSIPGAAPFIRGTDYILKEKAWEVCQELTVSTPKAFNEVAKHDLSRGQTALNIVLDTPTKSGVDANENAGDQGLSISSVQDLKEALAGINLSEIPLHINAGANALPFFAQLMATIKDNEQSTQTEDLTGCIGMDPLGELVANGSIPYSLESCYNAMADIIFWSKDNAPNLQTVIVDSSPYHNGGSNAVQEIAFSLATGVEYLQQLIDRGIAIDKAATSIRFVFSVGSDYFTEISKLRAVRVLWSKIVAAFGGKEQGQKMYIHARTSAWTKTKYDPYVNMLRDTTEAFSAGVGGANSIHVSPFDEPLQKATAFSRRIARNTSIILQEEAHVGKTTDPAGGSWYVEFLTDELAKKAWELFQQVEETGGITASLKLGNPQQQISDIKEKRWGNLDIRKDVFVGTNMYSNMTEKPVDVKPEDDSEFIQAHIKKVASYGHKTVTLSKDNATAQAITEATAGATLADIATALGQGSGDTEVQAIHATRATARFEELRQVTEEYIRTNGQAPKVFLANLGSVPSHKARADFATGFMEVASFEVISNNGFGSAEEAAKAALESGAEFTVICGKDESYAEHLVPLAKAIKAGNQDVTILLAGKPSEENEKAFREAGISDFIHVRSNCYEVLRKLQVEKGVVQG